MKTPTGNRICVVGAGAIGGFLAARLARAGNDVSVLARGKTLDAIRAHGIRLTSEGETFSALVRASGQASDLGVQDIVILAVKATGLPAVAALLGPLLGPDTMVVPALNGIPWWFFQSATGQLAGHPLRMADPEGKLGAAIPATSVVGAVVFPSSASPEPGVVVHAAGSRLVFGEPGGGDSARLHRLIAIMKQAGFAAESSDNIRMEVWLKVLGNACFNPVSLLTGSPTDRMIDDPGLYRLFTGMMLEVLALGNAIGVPVDIEPGPRLAFTRKLGNIKTSMLQDVEAGRAVEVDGIIGTLVEIAGQLEFKAPLLETVYAIARMRAQVLGLYPQ